MKIRLRWLGLGILGLVAVGCGSAIVGGGTGGSGGGSMATYVTCGSYIEPVFMPEGCPEGTSNACCQPDGCCCQCPGESSSSGASGGSSGVGGAGGGGGGGGGPADAGAD